MKNNYSNNICILWYFLLTHVFALTSYSQKYTEPDKLKQFNITVNYDDYTVKTQILSQNKTIDVNNELVYMWYGSQKIIETKGGYEGKLIHGKYTAFYLNNQLKEQGQIKYGLKTKEWKYWYPDGKLREVITWKKGRKNGKYLLYNDYGQLMAKSNFKDDKLNGKFYTYSQNGVIAEKKVYKNGDEIIPEIRVKKIQQPKEPKKIKEKKVKKEKKKKEPKPSETKVVIQ